jgi:hypothetical protein
VRKSPSRAASGRLRRNGGGAHITVRRTNADALPRLGAGYFSGLTPPAGTKTKPFGQVSPLDLDSQPSSLKLPSRLYYQTVPNRAGSQPVPYKENGDQRARTLLTSAAPRLAARKTLAEEYYWFNFLVRRVKVFLYIFYSM